MNFRNELIDDLKTLNDISQTLNRAVEVSGALDDALVRLIELMGLDSGWIFLRDESATEKWWGTGYVLAAHHNLPPALALDLEAAWKGGCDCQGFCNVGKLVEGYNEVRCSRLSEVAGDRRELLVHASAPLISGANTLGILNVAAPEWESFDVRSLALLTNAGTHIGVALERARLFDMLKERRIHEQTALLELSNQLLAKTQLDDLMQFIVSEVQRLQQVDAVALLLPYSDGELLAFRASVGWHSDPTSKGLLVPSDSQAGASRVMQSQEPLIVEKIGREGLPVELAESIHEEGFKSVAVVPLVVDGQSTGVLAIHMRETRQFRNDEIRFLQLMANQAAIALEKARLHEDEIRRQRQDEELLLGQEIQLSLLPKSCPTPEGWDFCDIYQAARQVGGDFYDYFELPGTSDRLGLVIGDVADKGVPAALFMGVSRTIIRSAAHSEESPAHALELANRLILEESQSGLFLSAFYAILDTHNGRLTFSNAGHNPPLWFRAATQEIQELSTDGMILCVLDDISLEEKTIFIDSSDVLVFYTDGVTEAMNIQLEEFGAARLHDALAASAHMSAADVLATIVNAVEEFTEKMEQSDDFTLFTVKRR
jgi:sigma-B regulation protein RsbU (phosphoserine phosphatase)